ncbi:MAG: right-handed parallel beta-helix repeat-containing protein [Fimbriimonadaceae bacterium]|nr:right-handed parallel beta-helix repeat-containing protein [Fimbriimonadaceae bacterium]
MTSLILAATLAYAPMQNINLTPGLTITQSCKVNRAEFLRPWGDESGKTGVITIKGEGITVDFNGATLRGTPETTEPDQRKGTGIRIEGKNITIRNLNVRGYKIGLIADGVEGLNLFDCDVSYNWKQHLKSTLEAEDTADWMSYHHNETDEWLKYGAAIYLKGCTGFEVKRARVNGGQCGLMMTNSTKGLVWNSDFSFNSGVGVGLYRSSDNRIMHNKIDWCVRGYSHGVYNRGQDSTGIIIFEQCHRNTFAFNSATHGGDGFFLWAGQHTMDTGQGGCNDNLLYGNDFSHSPANAIEATFSRNVFVNNFLVDCWHGVWGGYSYDTAILGNVFGMNGESIAIEHGQKNRIAYNYFDTDNNALYLWQNDNPPDPKWGYPKNKDTRNVGSEVFANVFRDVTGIAVDLGSGSDIGIRENMFDGYKTAFNYRGTQSGIEIEKNTLRGTLPTYKDGIQNVDNQWMQIGRPISAEIMTRGGNSFTDTPSAPLGTRSIEKQRDDLLDKLWKLWNPFGVSTVLPKPVRDYLGPDRTKLAEAEVQKYAVKPMDGGLNAFLPAGHPRGRRYMMVDEWGPYDFKRPILWPVGKTIEGNKVFEVTGPEGEFRLSVKKGLGLVQVNSKSLRQTNGETWYTLPATIEIQPSLASSNDRELGIIYVGKSAVTDYRGVVTPAGKPFKFGWSQFLAPIDWNVKFVAWDANSDPRTKLDAFHKLFDGPPVKQEKMTELKIVDGMPGLPANNYGTLAEGTLTIDPGNYILDVTADDGVRVWLDGKLLLDEWHWQGPTAYPIKVKLGGKHKIRIEHFEIDGYSTLQLRVKKA